MHPLLSRKGGHKPRKGAVIRCPRCGVEFYAPPSQSGRRVYCSRECYGHATAAIVDCSCAMCGKPFRKQRCYNAKYCSIRCSRDAKKPLNACRVCGKALPLRKLAFCSPACSAAGRRKGEMKPCEVCGNEMYVPPNAAKTKRFCSRPCLYKSQEITGPGAKYKRQDGYIAVYYPSHPDAPKGSWMILEHRLVMEQKLGRRLKRTEQVHHINGIRDDNRPENLELIDPASHTRLTNARAKKKRQNAKAELEEYRRRFGPLETS